MKTKIYLSDEGYGHVVRQRAILEELQKLDDSLDSTIQTKVHIQFAASNIPANSFIDKFNKIKWHKKEDELIQLLNQGNYTIALQDEANSESNVTIESYCLNRDHGFSISYFEHVIN
jgi:spore coat polysaccharide biosynthesis predicted glycosyltransferase SpsG